MKLNIKDRLYFPAIFPTQNTFAEYNLKREILSKITITEEEKEKYSINEDLETGVIKWNKDMDEQEPLIVEFSSDEIKYIKKCCEGLTASQQPDEFWLTPEKIYDDKN